MRYDLLLLLSASLGAAGDIALYRWARGGVAFGQMLTGLALWICSLLLWTLVIRWSDRGLSLSFVLTAAFHIIVVLAYDRIVERTAMSRFEVLGLILAVLGIVLIDLGQFQKPTEQPNSGHPGVSSENTSRDPD